MEYNLTSKALNWQLLILFGYALVLQKISRYFRRNRNVTVGMSNGLFVFAVVALIIGVSNSYRSWQYDQRQQSNAAHLVANANQHAASSNNRPKALEPQSVPSTVQPGANALVSYQVAPNMPRYLIIPKLHIQARVLSVGLDSDGSIGTPDNVYDTAWYDQSALPGQPGASLIDGHVSSWTSSGVFYSLNELNAGDTIEVERGDGLKRTFTVEKTIIYGSNDVNMSQVLSPITPGKPGLNLVSCFGSVISGTSEFNKRIVVFASAD